TEVPDSPALPTLIRQLSAAADSAGVNLVSLAPGQPALVPVTVVVKPGATTGTAPAAPATSAATAAAAPGALLAAIPLQIQVQGSYPNLQLFFAALEGLPRSMLVTQFNAAPLAQGSGAGATGTTAPDALNVTLTSPV